MASSLKLEHLGLLHPDFNQVQLEQSDIVQPIIRFVSAELGAIATRFISGADDTLFDMAERSCNNSEQTLLFESLRNLRKQKQTFMADFKQALEANEVSQVAPKTETNVISFEDAIENMKLVTDEDMERELAIANILVRVMQSSEVILNYVNLRFEALKKKQESAEFKYTPEYVCESFSIALRCFEFDMKRQIILYKAFERELVLVLPLIYDQVNEYLKQRGILPNVSAQMMAGFLRGDSDVFQSPQLKPKRTETPATPAKKDNVDSHNSWSDEISQELNSSLFDRQVTHPSFISRTSQPTRHGTNTASSSNHERQLFDDTSGALVNDNLIDEFGQRKHPQAEGYHSQLTDYAEQIQLLSRLLDHSKSQGSATPSNTSRGYSQQEMLSHLTQIQKQQAAQLSDSRVVDIRQLLQQQNQELPSVSRATIGKVNDDLIDIVAMMFQFVLDNRQLNVEVKAALGRLQIPMLKVAIADEKLFKSSSHPARLLFNCIAHEALAIGIKPRPEDRLMIKKIQTCIKQVMDNFDQDIEEFEYLLAEFKQFISVEKRRSDIIIERTRQAEEGKAKLERANKVTQRAFEKMLSTMTFDDTILDILQDGFQPVAAYYLLKHGQKSTAFKQLLKNIHRLTISISRQHRAQLSDQHLMGLNRVLKTYLAEIHTDRVKIQRWMQDVYKMQSAASIEVANQDAQLKTANKDKAEENNLKASLKKDRTAAQNTAPIMESAVQGDPVQNQAIKEARNQQPTSDNEVLAEKLSIGSWVEVLQANGWNRVRFIARLKSSQKMLFVNRVGIKMCEFTIQTFAQALEEGQVQIVDDSEAFEKALQAVVTNLKQMKNKNNL
jgi:hypothetical protein